MRKLTVSCLFQDHLREVNLNSSHWFSFLRLKSFHYAWLLCMYVSNLRKDYIKKYTLNSFVSTNYKICLVVWFSGLPIFVGLSIAEISFFSRQLHYFQKKKKKEYLTRTRKLLEAKLQRDKYLGCPLHKILGIILKVDERRTSANGAENKKTHDEA